MEAILVISTLKNCPACEVYKKTEHGKLLEALNKFPGLTYKHINYLSFDQNIDELTGDFNPQCLKFAIWFPTFALFPRKLWDDRSSPLKGLVQAGTVEYTDKKVSIKRTGIPVFESTKVVEWIEQSLKNPIFTPTSTKRYHSSFAVLDSQ